MENNNNNLEYWNSPIIKTMSRLAFFVVLFSVVAPLIFTSKSFCENFDFTQTGQIGDTIGGIVNPFIALAGVILTFLAFYMQIEANKLQISLFNKGLDEEKNSRVLLEKRDCINKIKLLQADLDFVISDISNKAKSLKDYYEKVGQNPLQTHILKRTVSSSYQRVLENDRLSIFSGFTKYFNKQNVSIKQFSELYNILDYVPQLFDEIYNKYDYHTKDNFELKIKIKDRLSDLINKLSQFRDETKKEPTRQDVHDIAKNVVNAYYQIIQKNLNQNTELSKETDLKEIDKYVVNCFLGELENIRDQISYRKEDLISMETLAQNLHQSIISLEKRSLEFASTIKDSYTKLKIKNGEYDSILETITTINNSLKLELRTINLEE